MTLGLTERGVSAHRRGVSLIEIIIVVALIATLMALSLPMLSSANAQARSQLCRQNLVDMGAVVTQYALDHAKMPSVSPLAPHQEGTSLPELVGPHLEMPSALYCPSDESKRSQVLGTSYQWAMTYNGVRVDSLSTVVNKPLLTDRDSFHKGTSIATNELVLKRTEGGKFQFVVTGGIDPDLIDRQDEDHLGKAKNDRKEKKHKKDKKDEGKRAKHRGHDDGQRVDDKHRLPKIDPDKVHTRAHRRSDDQH